jgi:hypothetical protein
MLQTDPKVVAAAIKADASLPNGVNFTEDNDFELQKGLMKEFNTLSILYGKTSENFISEKYQKVYTRMPPEHPCLLVGSCRHPHPHQPQLFTVAPATPGGGDVMDSRGSVAAHRLPLRLLLLLLVWL